MEIKQLLKSLSYLATAKFFQLITQVIRAKLNALILGIGGIGVYNQLNFFTSQTAQFSQLSVNEALVKQIAESKDDENIFNQIYSSIKAYFYIIVVITGFVLTILILFNKQIAIYLLGDKAIIEFYFISIMSIPIILLNSVFFAILRGFKDIKHISKARIFAAFSNIVLFIPLIIGLNIKGVIISIPITYIIISVWNLFYLNKYLLNPLGITIQEVKRSEINKSSLNEMFAFSGFGVIVGFLSLISEFFIRGTIVKELGIEQIGLYVPIISWTGIFTGIVLSSFNTYLFPRLCETTEKKETTEVLNASIRVSTLLLLPFVLIFITLKNELIIVFYSKDFLESTKYLPLHFFGLIWQIWFVVLGQSMAPKGFIKEHGLFRSISYGLDMIIVFFFISYVGIGLYGLMLKFLITPIVLFITYFIFLRIKQGFSLFSENVLLMIYLLVSVTVIIAVDYIWKGSFINYILTPLLIVGVLFLLNKHERNYLRKKLFLLMIRNKNNSLK